MDRLMRDFVEENKGKNIRLFLMNGFQLRCKLVDSDETHFKIGTNDYGGYKEPLISHTAISTYVPDSK